ncbi:mechanosensitive ion channel family protein [Gymnodinialimonas ceratoperidinii]|uniref:Mechanosensitive ion channel n=1 Tax=Gymnodinialimonas ceratoperidinii TaxID=2856823 RepID=A0A8F6TWJ9_9RHOB|nr:mechanosensitive ion channel domain-containing protein [Gymnodinialimonas ceratoperidinii]QXT39980.1 mechanosensitive ion channel [Gymnodinialimonas ceratoperidinii]
MDPDEIPPEIVDAEARALQQAMGEITGLVSQFETFMASLLRPWNAYQVGIVIAVMAVALLMRHIFGPPIRAWMASREGWPKWRMRILAIIHRRLFMIFFVISIWLVVGVMREVTWPSRSFLLIIVAELTTAWLFVVFVTRLIRSAFLRAIVRYGAWTYVTLEILNLRDETVSILDSVGFNLGDARLSLLTVVQGVLVVTALIVIARFLTGTASGRIQRNEEMSPSMQVLAIKFLQVTFYGIAIYAGLRLTGIDLTGLAVLSGAIGVGLGFGLQKVVSNLVSGVIILLDKSIKPGDVISLGETFGWINALGARYVSVVTRDGKEYLIPNEDLITSQVVNWSHSNEFVRLDIYFGTSYDNDPHEVRKLAIAAAKGVPRVLSHRAPVCHIVGFGDSSVDYILRFWITDPTGGLTNIRGNVYLALWDTFRENEISIPFPQREVRMLDKPAD